MPTRVIIHHRIVRTVSIQIQSVSTVGIFLLLGYSILPLSSTAPAAVRFVSSFFHYTDSFPTRQRNRYDNSLLSGGLLYRTTQPKKEPALLLLVKNILLSTELNSSGDILHSLFSLNLYSGSQAAFQLSSHSKEDILHFRNLGEKTFIELEQICQEYNIEVRSMLSIKEYFDKYQFPSKIYSLLFQNNISCLDDFRHRTVYDLYVICNKDYCLAMQT